MCVKCDFSKFKVAKLKNLEDEKPTLYTRASYIDFGRNRHQREWFAGIAEAQPGSYDASRTRRTHRINWRYEQWI